MINSLQTNKIKIYRSLTEPISKNLQLTMDKWLDIFEVRLREGVDPVDGVIIEAESRRPYFENDERGPRDGFVSIKIEIKTQTFPALVWDGNKVVKNEQETQEE